MTTLQSRAASVFFTALLPSRQGQVYVEQAPPSYWSAPVNPLPHWSTSPPQPAGHVSTIERHQLTKSCDSGGSLCCQFIETSQKQLHLLQIRLRAKEVCESKACHFCCVVVRQPSWQASTESEEEGSVEEESKATNKHGFAHSQDKVSKCSSRGPGG